MIDFWRGLAQLARFFFSCGNIVFVYCYSLICCSCYLLQVNEIGACSCTPILTPHPPYFYLFIYMYFTFSKWEAERKE